MNRFGFILFCAVAMALSFSANAQKKYITGIVIDSASNKPMAKVTVFNLTLKEGVRTNYRGTFSIEVDTDHYLKISQLGYKPRIIRIRDVNDIDFLRIQLSVGRQQLKAVKVSKPLTPYQKDSIERAEIYRDIYKYKQEKSGFSPVTTVFQKFSKKHKNKRRFKAQVVAWEKQKFIDTRYTREMVSRITGLQGDDLAYFMNAYPMEFEYARKASDLEITQWVSYNWLEYKRKNHLKE